MHLIVPFAAPLSEAGRHALQTLKLPQLDARLGRLTQVARRFRYEFGEVRVTSSEARLVEHFHTRTVKAPLDASGRFQVWVWTPRELAELVLVADRDVDVVRDPARASDLFDLRKEETRHAVCSRPAPMHLREVGLPPTFDRIAGPRDGRVDTQD